MKIDGKTIFVLVILGFVWGSSFILMNRGLVSFSASQVASLRLIFAGMIASFFFLKHFRSLKAADWPWLILSGTLGNFFPAYLFADAISSGMPHSLSGALNSMTPFFTLIFGVLLFSQIFVVRQVIGITVGLLGALILIVSKSEEGLAFESSYIIPALKVGLAALLYGVNVNIIKSKLSHLSPIVNSMVPLTIVSIPAWMVAISQNTLEVAMQAQALPALLCILALGVFGSALSLIVFNQLIKNTTALFASSVTYLIPVFAYMWGVFDDEPLGLFQIGGMVLILGGITLTRKR